MHKVRGVNRLGLETKLRLRLSTVLGTGLNTTTPEGLRPYIMPPLTCHDIGLCHLLWSGVYISHNTMHIVYICTSTQHVLYTQDAIITINSYIVPGHHGTLAHGIQCTCNTYEQYCQMYAHARRSPVNCNTIPSFRWLFHHCHTLLTGVLGIMLYPLRHSFIMIDAIIVIRIVQLTVAQKAQLGAAAAKVAVSVIHIAEACCAAIVWAWTYVGIVPLALAQDAVAPLGAFLVDMISAIFLALTAIKALLSLTSSTVECMFVVLLLSYASDGGIVDEGGTDSTTITPCHSSSVAVVGMVVVTSLVTSP
jgi:hypothetical protein